MPGVCSGDLGNLCLEGQERGRRNGFVRMSQRCAFEQVNKSVKHFLQAYNSRGAYSDVRIKQRQQESRVLWPLS